VAHGFRPRDAGADGGERHVEWIDKEGRDCRAAGAAIAVCTLAPTEVPSFGQHVRHNMLVSRVAAETTRSDATELLLALETQYLTLEDCARPGQQASVCYNSWSLGQGTLKV